MARQARANFSGWLFIAALFLLGLGGAARTEDKAGLDAGWAGPPLETDDEEDRFGAAWFRGEGGISALAISPDGRTTAVAEKGGLRLRNVDTGAEVRSFPGPWRGASAIAFSPDGRRLAVASREFSVGVLDLSSGKALWSGAADARVEVATVAFSPDGGLIASGGDDGAIRLLRASDGEEKSVLSYRFGDLRSVVFSPDGKLLAAAGAWGTNLWEVGTGREVNIFARRQMRWARETICVAFSPDSQLLVSGGERGSLWVWDLGAEGAFLRLRSASEGDIHWIGFTPGGRTLISAGTDRRVQLWDANTWEDDGDFSFRDDEEGVLGPVALSPDGWLAVASRAEGSVRVYDLATGAPGPEVAETSSLWGALADADVLRAQRAVNALASRPLDALPLLNDRLRPALPADSRNIEALISALDDDRFAERERAEAGLRRLGVRAEPALRNAHDDSHASAEARERASRILSEIRPSGSPAADPDGRRARLALMTLGRIGTPEARRIVERIASGDPDSPQTRGARSLLDRLPPSR